MLVISYFTASGKQVGKFSFCLDNRTGQRVPLGKYPPEGESEGGYTVIHTGRDGRTVKGWPRPETVTR